MKESKKLKSLYECLEQKHKLVVAIFFVVFLAVGILCFRDFGIPWDELEEQGILNSNVKEYVRLFGEDSDLIKRYKDVPDLNTYEEKDHGESMYYITATITNIFDLNDRGMILVRHLYTYLVFVGALFCLYLSIKFLTKNWKLGLLGSLFVFLSPRFFAENFYNNKDMILFSLVLITFWFGIKFIETKKVSYGCLFAIASAFAANTRIIGFYLIAIIGIFYILSLIMTKSFHKKTFMSGLITLITFFVVFLAITPASWQSPIEYFKYTLVTSTNFNRWDGFLLYRGVVYNPKLKPIPWHYIPVMFAITTPLFIVFFTIIGHFTSIFTVIKSKGKDFFLKEDKYYILLLLFVWLPLVFAMVNRSNLYNGWRHFYFIYGPFVILAMSGIHYLYQHSNHMIKTVLNVVVAVQLIVFMCITISMHPNQYVYYNILAQNQEKEYELDYWNVAATECVMKLLDQIDEDKVTISAVDWYAYDCLAKVATFLPESYAKRLEVLSAEDPRIADYYLSNTSYTNLIKVCYETNIGFGIPPFDYEGRGEFVTSVKANGVPLMEIYKEKTTE